MKPQPISTEAREAAISLAKMWWNERKLSYNWDADKDVEFLAVVIENRAIPKDGSYKP